LKNLVLKYQKVFLCLVLYLTQSEIFAQRGGSYTDTSSPWNSSTQGFPGYFDTNMAKPKSLVVEFPPMILGIIPTPSTAVDYGVSETLTVGTNAIVTTIPWLFRARGFSLKVRSLMYGDESQQSAMTYYAGFLSSNTSTELLANYHVFTWNHAWRFAPSQSLYGHANFHRINIELNNIDELNHAMIHLTTFLIGGGYEYEFSNTWSLRGDVLGSIYQNLEADSAVSTVNLSASITNPKAFTAIGTFQVQYHPFENWLFGFGATGVSLGGYTGALPWFTWSKRW
jgi:hypothetical protein